MQQSFQIHEYGPYILQERIAVGGMAEVFRARTFGAEGVERLIAVKRLHGHLCDDQAFVGMFIDEARLAATLQHINIAGIYDFGIQGGLPYIGMEYVRGCDLADLIIACRKKDRQLPLSLMVWILIEICNGLDYAHRKYDDLGRFLNLIHRDVNPQNVLLSYEGEVKLTDFGVAKARISGRAETTKGVLKGKFSYMSPEQVRGDRLDHRSDVFSLGVVAWELLTYRKMFEGNTDYHVLEKIRDTLFVPPREINPAIPESLEQILMRALTRSPKDRYSSVAEMRLALLRFLSQEGLHPARAQFSLFLRELFAEEIEALKQSIVEETKQAHRLHTAREIEKEAAKVKLAIDEELTTQDTNGVRHTLDRHTKARDEDKTAAIVAATSPDKNVEAQASFPLNEVLEEEAAPTVTNEGKKAQLGVAELESILFHGDATLGDRTSSHQWDPSLWEPTPTPTPDLSAFVTPADEFQAVSASQVAAVEKIQAEQQPSAKQESLQQSEEFETMHVAADSRPKPSPTISPVQQRDLGLLTAIPASPESAPAMSVPLQAQPQSQPLLQSGGLVPKTPDLSALGPNNLLQMFPNAPTHTPSDPIPVPQFGMIPGAMQETARHGLPDFAEEDNTLPPKPQKVQEPDVHNPFDVHSAYDAQSFSDAAWLAQHSPQHQRRLRWGITIGGLCVGLCLILLGQWISQPSPTPKKRLPALARQKKKVASASTQRFSHLEVVTQSKSAHIYLDGTLMARESLSTQLSPGKHSVEIHVWGKAPRPRIQRYPLQLKQGERKVLRYSP